MHKVIKIISCRYFFLGLIFTHIVRTELETHLFLYCALHPQLCTYRQDMAFCRESALTFLCLYIYICIYRHICYNISIYVMISPCIKPCIYCQDMAFLRKSPCVCICTYMCSKNYISTEKSRHLHVRLWPSWPKQNHSMQTRWA
jgi:hypothetical protein